MLIYSMAQSVILIYSIAQSIMLISDLALRSSDIGEITAPRWVKSFIRLAIALGCMSSVPSAFGPELDNLFACPPWTLPFVLPFLVSTPRSLPSQLA